MYNYNNILVSLVYVRHALVIIIHNSNNGILLTYTVHLILDLMMLDIFDQLV